MKAVIDLNSSQLIWEDFEFNNNYYLRIIIKYISERKRQFNEHYLVEFIGVVLDFILSVLYIFYADESRVRIIWLDLSPYEFLMKYSGFLNLSHIIKG